jgi:hypothetical protein
MADGRPMAMKDKDQSIELLIRKALQTDLSAAREGNCLDAAAVAALVDGTLTSHERAAMEAHAADCERCQALLAAMARTSSEVASGVGVWRRRFASLWQAPGVGWLAPIAAAALAIVVWMAVPGRPGPQVPSDLKLVPDAPGAKAAVDSATTPPASERAYELRRRDESGDEKKMLDAAARREADAPRAAEAPQATTPQTAGAPRQAGTPQAAGAPQQFTMSRDSDASRPTSPAAPVAPPAESAPAMSDRLNRAKAAEALEQSVGLDKLQARVAEKGSNKSSPGGIVITSANPSVRWRIVPGGLVDRSIDGGTNWQTQTTGAKVTLTAGSSPSSSVCWLVGPGGAVLVSIDGISWRRAAFPEDVDLTGVRATDDKTAIVVASDRRAFKTNDGGRTWVRATPQDF